MAQQSPVVLNINDDEASRYAISRILKSADFQVVEAVNGYDGLRMSLENPALIALDVKLPDINGFDVCQMIKSNPLTAKIPVLMISASFLQSADKVAGLERGADGYLTSPVEPQELIATIKALLRLREAEEAAQASAQDWEATFQSMSDALCLLDTHGVILRCNRAMTDLIGKPEPDILGAVYDDIAPRELQVFHVLDSAPREIQEITFGSRWFRVSSDPIFDENGDLKATVHVFTDTTDLRSAERENAQLFADLQVAVIKQRSFLRDVLANITEGRLLLCDTRDDLPAKLTAQHDKFFLSKKNLIDFRHQVEATALTLEFPEARWQDLVTAVSETAMNAVVHGGGGYAEICSNERGRMQIWVVDTGGGIAIDNIPQATLQRGYTTAGTLGHGFWLMLKTVDRIYLLTGATGTTIVLEQDRVTPEPLWFEKYSPI